MERGKRWSIGQVACLLAGVTVMAFGTTIITKTDLGAPPITSLPYVLCLHYDFSYGLFVLVFNAVMIAGQVALLRRRFPLSSLMQIPIALLFSFTIDGFTALLSQLHPQTYLSSCAFLLVGDVILAFGVTMTLLSRTTMNPPEGFVKALVDVMGWNFGISKAVYDTTMVLLAVGFGLIAAGHVEGVREGTVFIAVATGLLVNVFVRAYAVLQARHSGRFWNEEEGA